MAYYEYKATDARGNQYQEVVESREPQEVVSNLRSKGLQVNSIRPLREKGFSLLGWRRKISADDLMLFNRHLLSIVETDLPIVPGLKVLSKDLRKDGIKVVIERIRRDIDTGSSLSEAFAKHPDVFSELYVNMVNAGEKGGNLSGILRQLSSYSQAMLSLKKKFKEALTYPMFVVSFAVLVIILILTRLVPNISLVFEEMGMRPPFLTYALITFSKNLKANLLLIACVIVGLIILSKIIISAMRKTEDGKLFWDRFILNLPVFGELFRNAAYAQFCRTFGVLLNGGVPILLTLDLLRDASSNQVVVSAVQDLKKKVKQGEDISKGLHESSIFPQVLVWTASVGEKRGNLDKTFIELADFYDREVDKTASVINHFIEPMTIIILGGVVICVMALLFTPLFGLISRMAM
jgi:type IV pilus assembly protein PilC